MYKRFCMISSGIFLWICLSLSSAAQNSDAVLFTIDDEVVNRSDFDKIYKKSNANKPDLYSEESVKEYLDLYVKFKLKVKEAKELGYDTLASIKKELAQYRDQLAQSFLNDKEVTEKLMKEAYYRMKYDVEASHILIAVSENANPEDTLAAYNKAKDIKKRLKKEDFATVAKEVSDDPSVRKNEGKLGYFTAFQMVYPFETAAFTTPVGEVSNPIRTQFGYHLVKVHDKRPSSGKVKVAHIYLRLGKHASQEQKEQLKAKIDDLHQQLQNGADFADLARKYSNDKSSSNRGGELKWFGTGEMVAEFESVAFALENNGDISEPIHTPYGWHIIKRIDKQELQPYDEIKAELHQKVKKDSRSNVAREILLNRIKKEYGFKENLKARQKLAETMDSTLLQGKWKADKVKGYKQELFVLNGQPYTQYDLALYIEDNSRYRRMAKTVEELYNLYYKKFVEESLISYEESKLEEKYPEFKDLMKEYHEGILLFDITDDKVWSKAVKDSAGIENFYEQNKDNYTWDERVKARVYTCANSETADLLREELELNPAVSDDDLLKKFNKTGQTNLYIDTGTYVAGENEYVDVSNWEVGLSQNHFTPTNKAVIVKIEKVLEPQHKKLSEIRGQVISDYQEHLEKEWVESLKNKYTVKLNEKVLESLITNKNMKSTNTGTGFVEPSQQKGDRKGTYWLPFGSVVR